MGWLLMLGTASVMAADRPVTAGNRVPAKSEDSAIVGTLVTSEETDLALRVKMAALSEGLLNLRLPGPDMTAIFAPAVVVRDLAQASGVGDLSGGKISTNAWPIATADNSVTQPNLWRPLLDSIAWFEHAKVHLIRGEHPGAWLVNGAACALAPRKKCLARPTNHQDAPDGRRSVSSQPAPE